MNSDENITLLGREETQGKSKNQRLWNIICLIIGFGIILGSSWFSMQQDIGIRGVLVKNSGLAQVMDVKKVCEVRKQKPNFTIDSLTSLSY